eukprot:jgi/Pico_ML_1/53481/g4018.t1
MEAKVAVLGEDAELAKRFARHLGVEDTAEGRWTIDNEYYVAKTKEAEEMVYSLMSLMGLDADEA